LQPDRSVMQVPQTQTMEPGGDSYEHMAHSTDAGTIAVLGATGRTGKHFVRMALKLGHTIRGVCRSDEKVQLMTSEFQGQAHVTFVCADVWARTSLQQAIRGCGAVYSFLEFSREFGGCCDTYCDRRSCCILPRQRYIPAYREWATDLVTACKAEGITRVVVQTSWFSQTNLCNPINLFRTGNCVIACAMRAVCGTGMWNGFQMIEDVLMASELNYTIVRCPILDRTRENTETKRGFQTAAGKDQLGCPSPLPTSCCVPTGCSYICCAQRTYPDVARFFAENMDNFQFESVVFQ